MNEKDLIEQLVDEYKQDKITWHEIEDVVEAKVMQADGEGMTMDWETLRARVQQTSVILSKIENKIRGIE